MIMIIIIIVSVILNVSFLLITNPVRSLDLAIVINYYCCYWYYYFVLSLDPDESIATDLLVEQMNPVTTVVVVVSDAVLSLLSIANRLLLFLYLNYLSCYVNCDVVMLNL